MIDLSNLNLQQKAAVTTTDGPLLVLAGAGSGKTKVLTFRIGYLLDTGLASPQSIIAVTFTNKAAGEMKERLVSLLNKSNININIHDLKWIGTFHSVCVKILKQYGHLIGINPKFSIYDSQDQLMAIKIAMDNLKISTKELIPKVVLSNISMAKNNYVSFIKYKHLAYGYFQTKVADIYEEYQKVLKQNNAVDFDDILFFTLELLNKEGSVLSNLQNLFKYILIDEYQDTNHVQYLLANLLAQKYRNICCVGDDDQSIYSFRGATLSNIISFEQDYPEAKIIKLEQNYRSTKTILQASYDVISKNKNRKEKKLWTENSDGEKIYVYQSYDENDESEWIAQQIRIILNKGGNLSDVCILYRANAQSRSVEEGLLRNGIPYKIVGATRFYDRKEIKDIISYLKVVQNPSDFNSLSRIINVPRRNIGDKSLIELQEISYKLNGEVFDLSCLRKEDLPNKYHDFLLTYNDLLSKLNELYLSEYIEFLCNRVGYMEMLNDGTTEGSARIENLKELFSLATNYNFGKASETLGSFLDDIGLFEDFSDEQDYFNNSQKVTLMTVHASKGLEFDHVFIVGMEENLFPHSNSTSEEDIQEERRLAYVAITRAKKCLYITVAFNRTYFGKKQRNPVSRFLKDISLDLINVYSSEFIENDFLNLSNNKIFDNERAKLMLKVGNKVKHPYFGEGIVKDCDLDVVVVDFGNEYGTKELLLEYVNLELILK